MANGNGKVFIFAPADETGESHRELEVVARRSHRDRDGGCLPLSVPGVLHTDFERFFHRHEVHTVAEAAVVQSRNLDPRPTLPR